MGEGEGWAWSLIVFRPQESLAIQTSFNTLWGAQFQIEAHRTKKITYCTVLWLTAFEVRIKICFTYFEKTRTYPINLLPTKSEAYTLFKTRSSRSSWEIFNLFLTKQYSTVIEWKGQSTKTES
jgi:hypothetical protein